MARILCLAPSGFGKSTGIGKIKDEKRSIDFIGVNPLESYVISITTKPLPWGTSPKEWPVTTLDKIKFGRRVLLNKPSDVEKALIELHKSPVKNVILDDFNYIMQDWYMNNALRTGWDAPKQIGYDMGKIFKAIELYIDPNKNIIVLAHGEDVKANDNSGRVYTKMKTTGKMVA